MHTADRRAKFLEQESDIQCSGDLAATGVVIKGTKAWVAARRRSVAFQVGIVPTQFRSDREVVLRSPIKSAGDGNIVTALERWPARIEGNRNAKPTVVLVAKPFNTQRGTHLIVDVVDQVLVDPIPLGGIGCNCIGRGVDNDLAALLISKVVLEDVSPALVDLVLKYKTVKMTIAVDQLSTHSRARDILARMYGCRK